MSLYFNSVFPDTPSLSRKTNARFPNNDSVSRKTPLVFPNNEALTRQTVVSFPLTKYFSTDIASMFTDIEMMLVSFGWLTFFMSEFADESPARERDCSDLTIRKTLICAFFCAGYSGGDPLGATSRILAARTPCLEPKRERNPHSGFSRIPKVVR